MKQRRRWLWLGIAVGLAAIFSLVLLSIPSPKPLAFLDKYSPERRVLDSPEQGARVLRLTRTRFGPVYLLLIDAKYANLVVGDLRREFGGPSLTARQSSGPALYQWMGSTGFGLKLEQGEFAARSWKGYGLPELDRKKSYCLIHYSSEESWAEGAVRSMREFLHW